MAICPSKNARPLACSAAISLAVLALSSLGCGEGTHSGAPSSSAGASSAGAGGAGGTAGSGPLGGAGQGGRPASHRIECYLPAPAAPLRRYSARDLQSALEAHFGPGREFGESAFASDERTVSVALVRDLLEMVRERVAKLVLDEQRIRPCDASVEDRSACADAWLREWALKLHRRPLSEAQLAGYSSELALLSEDLPASDAAREVLVSLALSPYFVFRVELGNVAEALALPPPSGVAPLPDPFGPPGGTALDAFEVAARLAHFALQGAPDAALLESAASGQLLDPDTQLAEFQRLRQSAEGARANLQQQLAWLTLEQPPKADPEAPLPELFWQQTAFFVDDVLQNRGALLGELLHGPRVPLNSALAEHYGVSGPTGDALELVEVDGSRSAGVLTLGALLSRYPTPTRRGLFVVEQLLCTPFPEPPTVCFEEHEFQGDTPRERLLSVTQEPVCRGCHSRLDPIGFSLEAYDELGRPTAFDSSGSLPLPSGELPLADPGELGRALSNSDDVRRCAAQRYFERLVDRPVASDLDQAWVDCIWQNMRSQSPSDWSLDQLGEISVAVDALRLVARPSSTVTAASSAAHPLQHAAEETLLLQQAYSEPEDELLLDQYRQALEQLLLEP